MKEIHTSFVIFTTWGFEFERPVVYLMDLEFPDFISNIGEIEVDSKFINISLN